MALTTRNALGRVTVRAWIVPRISEIPAPGRAHGGPAGATESWCGHQRSSPAGSSGPSRPAQAVRDTSGLEGLREGEGVGRDGPDIKAGDPDPLPGPRAVTRPGPPVAAV